MERVLRIRRTVNRFINGRHLSNIRWCIQKFPDWVDNAISNSSNNRHSLRSTQEICIIWSSCSRRPVRKLLDTHSLTVWNRWKFALWTYKHIAFNYTTQRLITMLVYGIAVPERESEIVPKKQIFKTEVTTLLARTVILNMFWFAGLLNSSGFPHPDIVW